MVILNFAPRLHKTTNVLLKDIGQVVVTPWGGAISQSEASKAVVCVIYPKFYEAEPSNLKGTT